jgi:hypothetical protein
VLVLGPVPAHRLGHRLWHPGVPRRGSASSRAHARGRRQRAPRLPGGRASSAGAGHPRRSRTGLQRRPGAGPLAAPRAGRAGPGRGLGAAHPEVPCRTVCSTWTARSPSQPTTWPSSGRPSMASPPRPPRCHRPIGESNGPSVKRTWASTSACKFVAQAQRLGAGQFPWSRRGCPAASRPEPYGRRLRRRP